MTTISTSNHDNNEPSIPEELSKQLIQLYTPPGGGSGKRIPKETAKAVSEVIRMLVLEARSRASVEVSYRLEGEYNCCPYHD
jgi:hypothetical protein